MAPNPYIPVVENAFRDWLGPAQTAADLTEILMALPARDQAEFLAALVMVATAEVQSSRAMVFHILRDARENPPAGSSSAFPGQPDTCGGGEAAPAALSSRSCAGQRGTVGVMQAAPATRAGVEDPRPAPLALREARHG